MLARTKNERRPAAQVSWQTFIIKNKQVMYFEKKAWQQTCQVREPKPGSASNWNWFKGSTNMRELHKPQEIPVIECFARIFKTTLLKDDNTGKCSQMLN